MRADLLEPVAWVLRQLFVRQDSFQNDYAPSSWSSFFFKATVIVATTSSFLSFLSLVAQSYRETFVRMNYFSVESDSSLAIGFS